MLRAWVRAWVRWQGPCRSRAADSGRTQLLQAAPDSIGCDVSDPLPDESPQGMRRVAQHLAQCGHPHAPLWLDVAARTSQEAADALGVQVGQIAKSVVFRRKSDDAAVLVVTSGDRRVDEAKVAARVGEIGRASCRERVYLRV